jgi:predicted DsbA family dithiol-disulfide isomerase
MQVEIWSDVVCPWCYVGKKRFERALDTVPWRDEIEVRYRPFELDPTVPTAGVELDEYLTQKFGDRGRVRATHAHLTSAGAELGIEFRWLGQRRPNTFAAHRLLRWTLEHHGSGAQADLKERIMRAYFTEQLDVGQHDVLIELAGEAGLDRAAAGQAFADDRYADEVRRGEAEAASLGIYAVPTFVLERQLAVPGAQDVDTFRRYLERARERLAPVDHTDGDTPEPGED